MPHSELERDIYDSQQPQHGQEVELNHHQLHQLINHYAAKEFQGDTQDSGTPTPAYAENIYTRYAIIHSKNRDLSIPFILTNEGKIEFGEPTPVVGTYVPGTPTGDRDHDADDGVMAPPGTPKLT